ncbi:MAG: hypothetical protein FWG07_02195 [Treponema sp.]|nr:hypothetical protein [Treponema sp.]
MKKILILVILISMGGLVFAQDSFIDVGVGFQYGLAKVFEDGTTIRDIMNPGLVATFRMNPGAIGFFGRIGLLFPSKVKEGDLTVAYPDYDYILFVNGGLGVTFKQPIGDKMGFIIDAGVSINDLTYGGSFKDNIDTRWSIKIEQLGQTYSGGQYFKNVSMKETYNDFAIGLIINPALRFSFSQNISMELGMAVSYDFLRYRSYKFHADFTHSTLDETGNKPSSDVIQNNFPAGKLEGDKLILESDGKWSIVQQFTFIPSLSVIFSF